MADPAAAASAPLFGYGGGPAPAGAFASWFVGAGGARLRAALFPASGAPRGSVVVSPGRTEPIEKYLEVAERLNARGFVVLVHDWRGQGLSHRMLADRMLGHAVGYADFLTDYRALLDTFEARLPRPWIALGHSMGGCLTLLALARGEGRFEGAILSAPMLGLSTGAAPPRLGRAVAAILRLVGRAGVAVARRPMGETPFETNILTHDPVRYARNERLVSAVPDIALGSPTWGWLDFAFSAIAELARGPGVPRIAAPVTVMAAGEERLVDNTGSAAVAGRLPNGRYAVIPGAYHEILQETDIIQAPFWSAFDDLAARVVSASGQSGGGAQGDQRLIQ